MMLVLSFCRRISRSLETLNVTLGVASLVGTLAVSSLLLGLQATPSMAADVTFLSGIYQKSSDKVDGSSRGSTSTLSLGGRFSDDLTTETAWVAEGDLRLISYSAAAGSPSPDNAMGLKLGGGSRYYFKPIVEAVVPYATAIVTIKSEKALQWLANGYSETTKSGLYYGANAGLRAGLGNNFFVELEFDFFESPLFAVTKVETVTSAAGVNSTAKNETTESAIFAKSSVKFDEAKIGIGMLL
jgi:hypothetical protein